MSSFRSRANEALREGRVILASSSPRRREILTQLGLRFRVEKPGYDETPAMRELARPRNSLIFGTYLRKKLRSVILGKYHSFPRNPDHVVFCFDTIVHEGHQVMGKPGSPEIAMDMLRLLAGERHWVVTVCLAAFDGKIVVNFFSTEVVFRKLSEDDIRAYLASEDVLDAAGAYKIQEKGLGLVRSIRGSYHNVVGLPIEFVTQFL